MHAFISKTIKMFTQYLVDTGTALKTVEEVQWRLSLTTKITAL